MNTLTDIDKLLIQAASDRVNISTVGDSFKAADLLDLRSNIFKIYLQDGLSDAGRKVIWDMIGVLNNSGYSRIPQLREVDEKARVI